MFKLNITEEMIIFIKNLKKEYEVNSSELAKRIEKTSAYISKLENGDFKTITYTDLCEIISAICGEKEYAINLVDKFLTEYISKASQDDYFEDVGISTYANVVKVYQVPSELIDYINSEIKKLNMTINELVSKINLNEDLEESKKEPKYEYNVYYLSEIENSDNKELFIKINLCAEVVSKILTKKICKSNYINLQSIVYTIFRLNKQNELSSSILSEDILSNYKYYNIYNLKLAKHAINAYENCIDILIRFPDKFKITLFEFIKCIDAFYGKNMKYTMAKMNGLHNNLIYEPSLLISLLDLPFNKIRDLDIDKKKELAKDIYELIEKYSIIKPNDEKYQIID